MLVSELIAELQKCNPNNIVMYNFENAFTNDEFERMNDIAERHECEWDCSVDEVMIGGGTLSGFVFLREESLEKKKI